MRRLAQLGIAVLALTSLLTSGLAHAQAKQDYPLRPVRIIAGVFGSPSDMLARAIGGG
jgi:tripartite-type tricarboxylate transporter receptor subunit TctC